MTFLADDEDGNLQSAEVLIADLRAFQCCSLQLPKLKWMHTLWAGRTLFVSFLAFHDPNAAAEADFTD